MIEIRWVVIEIRRVENGELLVPVNNTLVCHTTFLATDTWQQFLFLSIIGKIIIALQHGIIQVGKNENIIGWSLTNTLVHVDQRDLIYNLRNACRYVLHLSTYPQELMLTVIHLPLINANMKQSPWICNPFSKCWFIQILIM